MINLEVPAKLLTVPNMARTLAKQVFRPISRKYDKAEHAKPIELVPVADMIRTTGVMNGPAEKGERAPSAGVKNGQNMMAVLTTAEMSWGDVAMLNSIPGLGLGNAAITAVGTPGQREKFGKLWCAMAITEPGAGSDTANIVTSARLDGDEWVLNGEKIFVTAGQFCDAVVVWATLDKKLGKRAIKSFIVPKGAPGMQVVRLEPKLGFRVSDTAAITFTDCRIPKDHVLGSAEIAEDAKQALGGAMQTFDNTRPVVAAMALGVARAALDLLYEILGREGFTPSYERSLWNASALEAEIYRMEADYEAARLLSLKAAWMADNKRPNSMEASMAKAKAGHMGNQVTLRCVELCSTLGFSEEYLLEKFARDSKILDIFEGTQQIQQLIVARAVLGLSSAQLK
ncbi:acyl-CoA dehydrogenase family protein [Pseudomonas sp. PDM16]|nr:acyl-CoA dehydrogenase family protein [Pseudomonas sp. PDM16]